MLFLVVFVIVFFGGFEFILFVMVVDNMKGLKYDSNKEFVGQGIVNMVVLLFGGILVMGVIVRMVINIKNGVVFFVFGVVYGVVVFFVLFVFVFYVFYVLFVSMVLIFMVVVWNMSECKEVVNMLRLKNVDFFILVVIFVLMVLFDLIVGVVIGLLFVFVFFIRRMSEVICIYN